MKIPLIGKAALIRTFARRFIRLACADAPEEDVPDCMPEGQAPLFESRTRSVLRAWRETLCAVLQQPLSRQDYEHLLGVLFPVGGDMQIAARL